MKNGISRLCPRLGSEGGVKGISGIEWNLDLTALVFLSTKSVQ